MRIPPPRTTLSGTFVKEVATTTCYLPSNTLLPLPRRPPSKALRKAQEERAKNAKKRGRAINRQADMEKAARRAAAHAVNKATPQEPVNTSNDDSANAGVAAGNAGVAAGNAPDKNENNNNKVQPPPKKQVLLIKKVFPYHVSGHSTINLKF